MKNITKFKEDCKAFSDKINSFKRQKTELLSQIEQLKPKVADFLKDGSLDEAMAVSSKIKTAKDGITAIDSQVKAQRSEYENLCLEYKAAYSKIHSAELDAQRQVQICQDALKAAQAATVDVRAYGNILNACMN